MTGLTDPFSVDDADTLHEECGVFGIFGHPGAGALTILGLHALQHRGQEAAGVVTYDHGQFIAERHPGLVGDIFGKKSDHAANLKGDYAIGHNRYSTAGGSAVRNIQPLFADLTGGGIAIAHNGNLTNAYALRSKLVQDGAIFQSTSDTEVIIHLTARSGKGPVVEKLIDALKQVEGAYSLVALTAKKLIGVRDPWGVRPLVLGMLDGAPIFASESCALDIIGAEFVRDIEPGEVVVFTKDGVESYFPFARQKPRFCIFEYIYFARPDSTVEGRNVYEARKAIGRELAHESPADADLVIPVPDSGVPAALGFSQAANIPFELGIIRNHYVGRTFIEPTDRIRHLGVRRKHNPNRATLAGKRVVLIDDSIVRGTTSKKIVQMVRDAGASEVHFRVASPPTRHSCFYGVDTPNEHALLAHEMNIEEMAKFIGVDSLAFISMDGLYRAVGEERRDPKAPKFCDACFSGDYPIRMTDEEIAKEGQLSFLVEVS
ncbi:amidophosphoribosyltransferase [Rhizomicrobium electricum]|uniref:Amidophosphoribosyltransferase n=1 Tax=Rhizomicrobium electricum TaxID=480070 RepID=A0ABN1ECV2_9PROT|nr:amidophosphoribosyltransferase [Rhizomicrobium electricum]NIJ48260.1 amidophosphoribosyltransferase [Rhizomicrobium electricum]